MHNDFLGSRHLRQMLLAGVILNLGLILWVVARHPATYREGGATSVAAPVIALLGYGVAGWRRRLPAADVQALGLRVGVVIGLVWLVQIVIENLIDVDGRINGPLALVTYAILIALYLVAGALGCRRTGRISGGIMASLWSGVVSSLIAVAVAIAINLLFLTRLEHNRLIYADYLQSGMRDLTAFTFQDTLGGSFFHMTLLGGIVAVVFGAAGAALAKARRA